MVGIINLGGVVLEGRLEDLREADVVIWWRCR